MILAMDAGKLWGGRSSLDQTVIDHVVTVTGVVCDAGTGTINGFYMTDSGRGKVSDMARYLSLADFREHEKSPATYAIHTIEPIKLWDENINATGNAMDNTLIGNRGQNLLAGGKGNDMLIGQAGNDTYVFSRGDGQDVILDRDATAGNSDVLQLSDVNQGNLWFEHVGNDLQIKVMGTSDQIIVQDWYIPGHSGADNQIEQIRTADGLTLMNTDVERIVQAMAAFGPPGAMQTNWRERQFFHEPVMLAMTH